MLVILVVKQHEPIDTESPAMLLPFCEGITTLFIHFLLENLLKIELKGIRIGKQPFGAFGIFVGGWLDIGRPAVFELLKVTDVRHNNLLPPLIFNVI